MKGAFVFSAGNLILRRKGGQGSRRHVCGALLIQREFLSRLGPPGSLPFHLTAWTAAGAWAGLGS